MDESSYGTTVPSNESTEDVIVEEVLVEEVSIDGMCGVY
ncbi:mycofactocin precursor MftA [Nocardia heshunensis]